MYYQQNRDRLKNIGNKSLQLSQYSDTRPLTGELLQQPFYKKGEKKQKLKTEYSKVGPDSLQLFQEQLNSALSGTRIKKTVKKTKEPTYIINHPSKETIEIKNQVNQIKTMLQSQRQIKDMQGKLQKLIFQLEEQKMKQNLQTQRSQQNPPMNYMNMPSNPFFIQQPQMMYPPPPPYYYPPPYPYQHTRYKPRRRRSDQYDSEDDEQYDRNKKKSRHHNKSRNTTPLSRTQTNQKSIKTRLRIILFVVAYTFFIRSQAKKLSTVRKSNLKKFWIDKFQSQINNMKNWFLDAQKYSLSIILQKKNLNFKFFDDKSQRLREQKQKLILQIVSIGVNKLLQDSTPQKVFSFFRINFESLQKRKFRHKQILDSLINVTNLHF